MTTPDPNEDPVEWILLDTDLTTVLAILPAVDARLYIERNEPGNGSLKVHSLRSAAAGLIAENQFVLCKYRGAIRGGFFIEHIDRTTVSSGESTDLWTVISGRGPLTLLNRATVWGVGPTIATAVATKGSIIHAGLTQAQTRGCFDMLAWDFNGTDDSASVAWDDTESMEFTVGKKYLDVMRTFVSMGLYFDVSIETDGTFTLHAYKTAPGTDQSETIILRRGVNVVEANQRVNAAEIINAYNVKYGFGDTVGYVEVEDAASIAAYGRREGLLDATDTNTLESATNFVTAELARSNKPKEELSLKVTDRSLASRVFLDYDIGDTISYDASGDVTVPERIASLQLEWIGDDELAQVTIGFGDPIYDEDMKQSQAIRDLQEMTPRIGNTAAGGGGGQATYTWTVSLTSIEFVDGLGISFPGPVLPVEKTITQIDCYMVGLPDAYANFKLDFRTDPSVYGTDVLEWDAEADITLKTYTNASSPSIVEPVIPVNNILMLTPTYWDGTVYFMTVTVRFE
jgi:hypothetical protein